jgi:two-component system osmolarity sensor histidine kinase EnvZ
VSPLPRSLFGRNLLLLAGLAVVVELCTLLAFYQFVQKPRIEQLALFTAAHLDVMQTALGALPPGEREQYIAKLNRSPNMHVYPADAGEGGFTAPRNPMVVSFVDELQKHLGAGADIRWKSDPQPQLWVRLRLRNGDYWFQVSGERLATQTSAIWLAAALIGGLAALACAYLIQRRINRPLRDLAQAAEQVGRGGPRKPLAEDGPDEIAAVSRSFNAMARNLERLDSERAVMLAGVSHDLRTPLTKLQLGVAMLTPDRDEDLKAGMVRHIEEINATIEQFVDFARSGSDEPEAPCDLNAIVQALAAEFEAQGIVFELELGRLPEMRLRPVAMRRLVANLMRNAVRYAGTSGLAAATKVEGAAVRLAILDRGPGIPPGEAERMKQAFTRLDEARSKGAGSGLGLAIVERVARLHGGELALLPRAGGGLEAVVTLPLRQA